MEPNDQIDELIREMQAESGYIQDSLDPIPGTSCTKDLEDPLDIIVEPWIGIAKEEPASVQELRLCKICKEPLEQWQQSLSKQVIHKDSPCGNCKYCGNPVGLDRILQCLDKEDPISHSPCLDKAIAEEFNSRPVTITQGHLNYLNRLIQFAYRPIPGHTIEELQAIAINSSNLFIKDMPDIEDRFRHMKMMEAVCANLAIVLYNDKEKIRLKIEREDIAKHVKIRDLQKVHDAGYIREKQEHDKELANERKRIASDPALRAREKTIVQMVGMGFTREAAETFIDKQKNAASGSETK